MRIAVDMGHCPKSTGASGYLDELTETRRIGNALIAELRARGHSVVNVTPADSENENLSGRAQRANSAGCDLFVSVHLNAGGGTGTEVYTVVNSGAKSQAAAVSAAVAEVLGLKNRGHKNANFTVLVVTSMPAMLVEVCFVDTAKDAEYYKRCTPEKIAAAIASGILGGSKTPVSSGSGSGSAKVETPSKSGYLVRVTADVLNVRDGAGTEFGVNTTVRAGEVYTIVGEKTNGSDKWGELKSGAGWISLAYTEGVDAVSKPSKSNDEIAAEVIAGKWGNGEDRKNRLQAAGYDYAAVQNAVNAKLGGGSVPSGKKSVDAIAREVINGDWGNGEERKRRLAAAGYDYSAVQKRVNQLV